jgi:hypothetical protein
VEARLEAFDGAEVERKEVEEEGTIRLGGERDHLSLLFLVGFIKDDLQIRRFAAETGAVIDDFAVDLACREIDKTQDCPLSVATRGAARGMPTRDDNAACMYLYYMAADGRIWILSNTRCDLNIT